MKKKLETIKEVLLEIDKLRKEAKGKPQEEQVRLLVRRQRVQRKIDLRGITSLPTETLLEEANKIYERQIGDRLTEDAYGVLDRLLWGEINRRRGGR